MTNEEKNLLIKELSRIDCEEYGRWKARESQEALEETMVVLKQEQVDKEKLLESKKIEFKEGTTKEREQAKTLMPLEIMLPLKEEIRSLERRVDDLKYIIIDYPQEKDVVVLASRNLYNQTEVHKTYFQRQSELRQLIWG